MSYVRIYREKINEDGREVPCEPFAVLDGEFDADALKAIIRRLESTEDKSQ